MYDSSLPCERPADAKLDEMLGSFAKGSCRTCAILNVILARTKSLASSWRLLDRAYLICLNVVTCSRRPPVQQRRLTLALWTFW